MILLIGIDDTDNLESRGTGWLARELGRLLNEKGIARLLMVTRHQLLVNPAIPYTSHNSSASLRVEASGNEPVIDFARDFLLHNSATGSDAGLCVCAEDAVPDEIIAWGSSAKKEVLIKETAHQLAHTRNIFLEGLTGTRIGVIGALAAVGLRKGGNDGRILWLPGLRSVQGISTPARLKAEVSIEQVLTCEGKSIPLSAEIELGEWVRPVMRNKLSTLFVEENQHGNTTYRTASKDFIKRISE